MQRLLLGAFRLLLGLYPSAYRAEYADEMVFVYEQVLSRAAKRGRLELLVESSRELYSLPGVILRLYAGRIPGGLRHLARNGPVWITAWLTSLPPTDRDGRTSWKQALLELLVFAIIGGILLIELYLRQGPAGWENHMFRIATHLIAVGLLPVGILQGMPRWAYPVVGLILGYSAASADNSSFTILYIFFLAAAIVLVIAAARLPLRTGAVQDERLQRMGAGLAAGSGRLAFGVYGLLPLLLIMAYDHSYLPGRTPAVLISVVGMLLGALVFSRSHNNLLSLVSLVGGLTFSLFAAFTELLYLRGGLWQNDLVWMASLWLAPLILLLLAARLSMHPLSLVQEEKRGIKI
jgi:hypothetical protein